MADRLITIAFYVFFYASSAVFFVVALLIWLITLPFDRKRKALHLFSSFWASMYLWIMPHWDVSVEGREKIRKEEAYVVVSNHLSALDILVAYRLFFHFKWVSKAEVFYIPFVGWNMLLNGYIKLRRGKRESIQRMIDDCRRALRKGNSVFIFPEGTRSETGEVKRFKPGAFVLARDEQVPILPVMISGTENALPKKQLTITGFHKITVRVLDEIPCDRFKDMPVAEIAEMTRQKIVAALKNLPEAVESARS